MLPYYKTDTIEVWPYAQTRLCCPCLHHFRATPTSLCPLQHLTELIPLAHCLLQVGVLQRRWDLRSYLRNLSPHATGLTPGPPQVLMPFSSLRTMAFSIVVEDRRIACCKQVYPAPGLSQLYPSGVSLRGCTIRFMLRPAALAGIPDWVKPMPLIQWAKAVSTPCRGKFSPCVTARTRPQPAYPKGQLI